MPRRSGRYPSRVVSAPARSGRGEAPPDCRVASGWAQCGDGGQSSTSSLSRSVARRGGGECRRMAVSLAKRWEWSDEAAGYDWLADSAGDQLLAFSPNSGVAALRVLGTQAELVWRFSDPAGE